MAEPSQAKRPLPIVPYLKVPDSGDPYLEGHRCRRCSAMFLGERSVCGSCGARGQMEAVRLSDQGELYAYSITHRSFPGIEVPFVSAIVDLDGGGTVKTNLIGVDLDPEKIRMGMRVRLVYRSAGRKDREGNEYLTFAAQPAS
jgi:uncharacterized OB-fold protein